MQHIGDESVNTNINLEVNFKELLDKVKANNELNNYLIDFKVSEHTRLNI